MAVLRLLYYSYMCLNVRSDIFEQSSCHYDRPSGTVTYDTIVVGLGSAGTTAASTLARTGRRVLALEAQDRIGGRIHTLDLGKDGVVELGAEWIHGTHHSRVYDAAMQQNIPVHPQNTKLRVFKSDGLEIDRDLVKDIMAVAFEALKNITEEPQSIKLLVTNRLMKYIRETRTELLHDAELLNGLLKCVYQQLNTQEGSNDPGDVTTASDYEDLEGNKEMSWHTYGYKTFLEIILHEDKIASSPIALGILGKPAFIFGNIVSYHQNTYKNGSGLPTLKIKLNTEVTKIKYPHNPNENVEVTTRDGCVYHAKNVIVTVSLGVLKDRHTTLISPPLPNDKVTAIKVMSMGLLGKIILFFDEIWWSTDKDEMFGFIWKDEDKLKVAVEDQWMLDIIAPTSSMGNNHSLTLWTTGDTGKHVETLSEELLKIKCMEILRKFMGVRRKIPEPTRIIRTTWYSNSFTRGSYTFDNLQTPQYPDSRATLSQPLRDAAGNPRVLFAGEATSETHFSTVHGASETGYREASRLLCSM